MSEEIDITIDEDKAARMARERADVKRWNDRINAARKYDEAARKQYAKDRRYARGDSGFEVDANLIGTYIDIMGSFLYARNPDLDVRPAAATSPPTSDALEAAATDIAVVPPEVEAEIEAASEQAVATGASIQDAGAVAAKAHAFALHAATAEAVSEMRKTFAAERRHTRVFAESLEIVVSRMWHDARLKSRGVRWARSALTTGMGVLKASWQERTAPSPETAKRMRDVKARINAVRAAAEQIAEADTDMEAEVAELEMELQTLTSLPRDTIERGFVCDFVFPEDFQIPQGYTYCDAQDAPWNAQRMPMLLADARRDFELTEAQVKQATRYAPAEVDIGRRETPEIDAELGATDAERFRKDTDVEAAWVMAWEIWDSRSGMVLTLVEGVDRWVKEPFQPIGTTRWYPYFVLGLSEVDGQRHPQSLVSRSARLVDEYNRIGSAEAEHRRRCIPGVLFDKGQIQPDSMTDINSSVRMEYTGVESTQPNRPISEAFFSKPYAPLDPALYSRVRITEELERIWGIQEALTGAVNIEKTATEAQIQQHGFESRSQSRRDEVEVQLTELALYTAEIVWQVLSQDDVRKIAGMNAVWPDHGADLAALVRVDIRAGTSGKPNTAADRQAWAAVLPLLQKGVVEIGQLRQSAPGDIADSLEMLTQITAEQSGLRIDIENLVPHATDQGHQEPNNGQVAQAGPGNAGPGNARLGSPRVNGETASPGNAGPALQ